MIILQYESTERRVPLFSRVGRAGEVKNPDSLSTSLYICGSRPTFLALLLVSYCTNSWKVGKWKVSVCTHCNMKNENEIVIAAFILCYDHCVGTELDSGTSLPYQWFGKLHFLICFRRSSESMLFIYSVPKNKIIFIIFKHVSTLMTVQSIWIWGTILFTSENICPKVNNWFLQSRIAR